MTRTSKALIVLFIAALGLWGCAQSPSAQSAAHAERIRALEAKCVKIEDDYRAVAGEKDRLRKQTANLEADNGRLQKEVDRLKVVLQERDQLRQALEASTSERDVMQVRCDKMKKGLQSLIGQDNAMLTPSQPAAPVSAVPASRIRGQS